MFLAFIVIANQNVLGAVQQLLPDSLQADLKPAPKYCANTLEGKVSCIDDFRGRPILVNVWATWCIPCREEMPALEALYKEFSDKGIRCYWGKCGQHWFSKKD
jgi:thiol-disulfide isomerase/thioredoxin